MVPIIKSTNATHKNENIEHLIPKQHFFYSQMECSKTFDFVELDRLNKTINKTARDVVMSLRTLDGSDSKLFWSIDKDASGACYLTYPSHIAEHARNLVAQLPSLLRFAYGKEALKLMSDSAVRKVLAAPWDAKKMRVISKEDQKLEAMIVATNTMISGLDGEDLSEDSSDDDSIDTKEELDRSDDRETARYLFQQASSTASVTTIDTRIGTSKPTHNDDNVSHEIEPSPTKKRKENHHASDDEDTDMDADSLTGSMEHDEYDDDGADSTGQLDQHRPTPPGPSEGPGALP